MMIWFWLVLGFVFLLLVAVFFISQSFQNARFPHRTTPSDHGIPFEEVHFPTKNQRRLYGWWIPASHSGGATSPHTLILVHGWGRNLERTMPYITHLHPRRYNLLAFDARHHGSSDPDRISSMLKFAEDIMAAVVYVAERQKHSSDAKIGVIGLSVGGAAAIYASAHEPRICCAVAVGAFAHPMDIISYEFKRRHVPFYPLGWLVLQYIQYRIRARFHAFAPVNHIARSRARILLVHGEKDRTVPVEQAHKLYQAAGSDRVQLLLYPDRGHSDCHESEGFWEKLEEFLQTCLANCEPADVSSRNSIAASY